MSVLVYATPAAREQAAEILPPGHCIEVEVARRITRSSSPYTRFTYTGGRLEPGLRAMHCEDWTAFLRRDRARLDPGRTAWLVVAVEGRPTVTHVEDG